MTPTIKKALSLIALISVCTYATEDWQFDYETGANRTNFTIKQRVATGALNILPGVGSYFIMDDFTGAVVQWALGGAGAVSIVFASQACDDDFPLAGCGAQNALIVVGVSLLSANYLYNIYRSITYDKPKKTALGEHDGFNVAVLPDRNGKLNAFLMFNKAF